MQGGGGENSRNFHVVANGRRILSDFDILSDGEGPGIADVRAFKDITPSDDGILRLRFISVTGQAMVNAIEITPSRKGLLDPIRMTAADSPTTDSHGHTWLPDSYFIGGRTNTHTSPVQDTQDPNLYSHERYGRFRYNIPVGDGDYALTLYLAETFWGTENPGGGGPGTRVFDIFCNGVALARDIDIYRRAGANKPLVLHFDGLHPNAQGKLSLSFLPVRNYASVFAIEVEDVTGQ